MLEFLKIVMIAGLSGGLLATAVNIYYNIYLDEKKFKREYIEKQLKELYGPLNSLVSQNEICFERSNSIHEEYKKEYIDKNYSDDDKVQERINKRAMQTIDTANKYITESVSNNEKVYYIVNKNYYLFDINDHKMVSDYFIKHYLYYKIEMSKNNNLPFMIKHNLEKKEGSISYMRPEFIKMIQDKYERKKNLLITIKQNKSKGYKSFKLYLK